MEFWTSGKQRPVLSKVWDFIYFQWKHNYTSPCCQQLTETLSYVVHLAYYALTEEKTEWTCCNFKQKTWDWLRLIDSRRKSVCGAEIRVMRLIFPPPAIYLSSPDKKQLFSWRCMLCIWHLSESLKPPYVTAENRAKGQWVGTLTKMALIPICRRASRRSQLACWRFVKHHLRWCHKGHLRETLASWAPSQSLTSQPSRLRLLKPQQGEGY